jgi:mannose/fructose/N-acetylgalactosamine-specific phosphotransferase system component IIB
MSIELFRVDERLIHGQVVVGWGERLHADRIIVVDPEIVESPWEQELYCLGVPPSMETSFVSVEDARPLLARWQEDPRRTIVLLRSVDVLARLADGGLLDSVEINLGGLHHAPDRERVLPYLFLSDRDRDTLAGVAAQGVAITARDLPSSRAVPIDELLDRG